MLDFFNILNLVLLLVLSFFLINNKSFLYFLLLTEMVWILFYIIFITLGLYFDVFYLLTLTLFLLVIAALEISIGLVLFYFF